MKLYFSGNIDSERENRYIENSFKHGSKEFHRMISFFYVLKNPSNYYHIFKPQRDRNKEGSN